MLPWSDGWSWLPVDSEWQMVHPVTCKIFYICVPFSSVLWQRSRCFWHVGSESSSNHKGLLQQHDVILDVFTPKTRPSPAQVLCIMFFFFFFFFFRAVLDDVILVFVDPLKLNTPHRCPVSSPKTACLLRHGNCVLQLLCSGGSGKRSTVV